MSEKLKHTLKMSLLDYTLILVGAVVYALSVTLFSRPASIPLGGVSGIAQIINLLSGFPMGITNILLNIPLFLISLGSFGKSFLAKTIFAVATSSVAIDIMWRYFGEMKPVTENYLLAALYAGVLSGIGFGLVFSRGATTGGSDILSKMINKKFSHLTVGRVNMFINIIVVVLTSIVFKRVEATLFAIVAQYVSGTVVDTVIKGADNSNATLIITTEPQKIADMVLTELRRGCTGYDSEGMFTHNTHTTLLVVVRTHEIATLKKVVKAADPNAFTVLLSTHEVLGRGFKSIGG